jgi:SagB-type dehydrogenase family enzyme
LPEQHGPSLLTRTPRRLRFRRSPHVVAFWNGAYVVLHNYATGRRAAGGSALYAVADACFSWVSLEEIRARRRELTRAAVRMLVSDLLHADVLHRSDRKPPDVERAMQTFGPWNPAAGFFHTESKDVVFVDRAITQHLQQRRAHVEPMPAPVKRYPGLARVRLPNPSIGGEFPEILLRRRTWRRFGLGRMSVAKLAVLLRLTAGMHLWAPTALGRIPLRTSPSGGAMHPIEVYVVALKVEGLASGLYHYASDRHELERLRRGTRSGGVQRYLPTQYWYEDAAALVLFAARFERLLWRYQYTRAYRAAAIEAGHLCQTFCLTATWQGLAPFCSMALEDRKIDRDLGLDGISESVLYAAGVGVRPSDRRDGAAPPDVRCRRPVPNAVFQRTG